MKSKTLSPALFLTLMLLLINITNTHAQRFYINLDGSYGFNASSASYGNASTFIAANVTQPNGVTAFYNVNYNETGNISLATGVNIGGIIGYNICKHFNVEVGCYSVAGNTESYNFSNIFYNQYSYYYTDNWKASMIRIVPAIKLACDSAKWIPYMKFGMAIGFISSMTNDETGVDNILVNQFNTTVTTISTSEVITKYTGSATIGFMAALGVDYSINERFGFFAEINYTGMSWAPTKSVITKSTFNGVDNLADLTTFQSQVNYVNTYTTPSITSLSTNFQSQPNTELKQYYPFSTWGFNIGVKFNFGKKTNANTSQ
jgi:hypothetical protein